MKKGDLFFSLTVLFLFLSFCGCTAIPARTSAGYSDQCRSFLGQDIRSIIANRGNCDKTLTTKNGDKVYVYVDIMDPFLYNFPSLLSYPPALKQPKASEGIISEYTRWDNCVTYFETDAAGKIVKIIWTGACEAPQSN